MSQHSKLVESLFTMLPENVSSSNDDGGGVDESSTSSVKSLQKGLENVGKNFVSATFKDFNAMFNKESELPQLPVPVLKDTMTKFIETLRPITLEHDMQNIQQIVDDFIKSGGEGELLQEKLILTTLCFFQILKTNKEILKINII